MSRVIIVGWDGATWDLLDRLIASDRLPNLKAFLGRAARGPMASTRPPVTAPAWVSIATGVNPGRHGCFDFNKPEDGLSSLRPLQTWDIAEKTFYEVLAERGRRTVLVNLPVSHPPLTDQPTLTSLLTQGDNAIFPEALKDKYPVLDEYRCFPDTRLRAEGESAAYQEDIRAVEAARFNCAKALWEEPWDVFFVVFSGTDWVSHEAFPDLMEGRFEKCSEALGMFEDADGYLGWIVEQARPDDHVLMVSDHGFCEAKGIFHLNEWLASEGYLTPDFHKTAFPPSHKMEEAARKAFEKQGRPMPPGILRLCYGNGLCRFAGKVYRKLFKRWPISLGVDAARSRASTLTAECLGVTVHEAGRWPEGTVQPDQVAPLADEIRAKLSALRDPDGKPVFTAVQKREDVHHGPKARRGRPRPARPGQVGRRRRRPRPALLALRAPAYGHSLLHRHLRRRRPRHRARPHRGRPHPPRRRPHGLLPPRRSPPRRPRRRPQPRPLPRRRPRKGPPRLRQGRSPHPHPPPARSRRGPETPQRPRVHGVGRAKGERRKTGSKKRADGMPPGARLRAHRSIEGTMCEDRLSPGALSLARMGKARILRRYSYSVHADISDRRVAGN